MRLIAISGLFIFLFSIQSFAFEMNLEGHVVSIQKQRGSSTFFVDGQVFSHSGAIRLKRSQLFRPNREMELSSQLYIVQFESSIFSSFQKEMEKQGIEILKFVPDYALLVKATAEQIQSLEKQVHIKQIQKFDGAYKVSGLPSQLWLQSEIFTTHRYDVLPISDFYRKDVLNLAQSMGLTVVHSGLASFALTLRASLEDIEALAEDPRVLWIELAPDRIEEDMDVVLQQGGVQSLTQSTGAYEGLGIRGHVLEGINRDHQDYVKDPFREAPIAVGDDTFSHHGQQTFGIIYGSGEGDSKAKGVMPKAQGLYTNSQFVFDKDNRYLHTQELIQDHQIMLQTASWGNPTTTDYTARSLEMDKIIFELDIPITQSQSNRKNKFSRPQAWAKNIISVGAVHHGNNLNFQDDSWTKGGASIGPASDNRIKPDIVSYYDDIHTVGKDLYSNFGGTSAATPIVNGHLGLIMEMFTDGVFGNILNHPTKDRFANRPHAATAKALLINSARQYSFQGLDHDLTRTHQGWGHPDLSHLYNSREEMFLINEEHLLKTMEKRVYSLQVLPNQPQLRATLVYSDPDGILGAAIHRVNDLSLVVRDPNGQVYHGNFGLYENNFNLPGGEMDSINTVENVFLENPIPGLWEIEVVATEVNQDGHLETPEIDADFALVVTGVQRP